MKTALTILLLLCACPILAQPTNVAVPNALANVEGNSSMGDFLNSSSFRMQMVFDASQFSSLNPMSNNIIRGISFRIDGASTFDVASFFGGASVTLSTTPRAPDGLSSIFADNLGPNAVTVYNGAVGFGAAYQPGMNPQPFAENITLTRSFSYSPSQGNLLLDIIAGSGQILFPGELDAESTVGDGISRVFANSAGASSGTADTLGLVTRFNFFVIPEPSSLLLIIMGLAVVMAFRRKVWPF